MSGLDRVVERVKTLDEPWRVAIDGVTAAGKTTVADELALRLDESAVVDGVFLHHPDLRDLWT